MRSYERSGVTVDQCSECRGIFLDRGELEKLVDVENAHIAAAAPQREPEREYREPEREYREHREEHYREREHHGYSQGRHGKPRKKRSIFEELFD
jgi:uncharacterized protein